MSVVAREHPWFGRVEFDADSKPLCHLCGRAFRSVSGHVMHGHGISAAVYKEMFGLAKSRGVLAPASRQSYASAVMARLDVAEATARLRANRGRARGARRAETVMRGNRHPNAVVTEQQAIQVIAWHAASRTCSCREIASRTGIRVDTVRAIVKGANWRHLARPEDADHRNRLTDDERRVILLLRSEGLTYPAIQQRTGRSWSTVARAVRASRQPKALANDSDGI